MRQLEELLWNTAKADAGITVFYKRGGEGMELTVVPGAGGNDALGFGGNRMQDPSKTFSAGVADLRNFYPPQKNDVIQFRETGKCYTVKSDATGAVFREIGAYGTMIQIHVVSD